MGPSTEVVLIHKGKNEDYRMRKATDELTGVIRCGVCGAPYKARHQDQGKYKCDFYYHPNLWGGDCHNKPRTVQRHILLSIFQIFYGQAFLEKQNRQGWLKLKMAEIEKKTAQTDDKVRLLRKKLAELDKQKRRIVKAIAEDIMPAETAREQMAEIVLSE
jgi:hypothetical protein